MLFITDSYCSILFYNVQPFIRVVNMPFLIVVFVFSRLLDNE